ncbi:hypothetical protein [Flavobacterium sasangense]|jgi:hypothetical protein|nr:hypothetical protein [Flavobacterium sasangense]
MKTKIIHHLNEAMDRIAYSEKVTTLFGFVIRRSVINRLKSI